MKIKKKKIDLQRFIDSIGFIHNLGKVSILKADFSCIFEKDLTLANKRKLKSQFNDDLPRVLKMFFAVPEFAKQVGAQFRSEIQIGQSKDGTEFSVTIKK